MAISKFTQNLMAKFPSWMKMSKDVNSLGAQFLDVFGLTFEDVQDEIDEMVRNFYITTANTEIVDWIYKVPLQTERVVDSNGSIDIQEITITNNDGSVMQVYRSNNVQNFYHRNAQMPNYWLDRANEVIYLRIDLDYIEDWDNPFETITINGANHYDLFLHQVWNLFDEFGLLVGLKRLNKEPNRWFKERILDVFRNPGNVSRNGIYNGIARELDINPELINIKSLDDVEEDDSLTYSDGTPTRKLMRYAKQINQTLKYSWDDLNLDQAYWFSVSQNNMAIDYLPHIWDVDTSAFKKEEFQSGTGYDDDLLVHKPREERRERNVKVSIGLMGYTDAYEEVYPELVFTYKIYAKGKIIERDYQPQSFKFTVQSAEVFEQPYSVHAEADIYDNYNLRFNSANDIATGTTSPNIQFGKSTDILHDQKDEMVKLTVKPKRFNEKESPQLDYLSLIWEDTEGQEHTYRFDTQDDFFIDAFNKAGNPITNVLTSNMYFSETKGLTLGYGLFQDEIDTTEEWKTGTWDVNNIVIEQGALKLNLGQYYSDNIFGPK